jgi:hypothetical protein
LGLVVSLLAVGDLNLHRWLLWIALPESSTAAIVSQSAGAGTDQDSVSTGQSEPTTQVVAANR